MSTVAGTAILPITRSSNHDLMDVIFGFGLILVVLWVPVHLQRALSPAAFVATLGLVLIRQKSEGRLSADELGFTRRGFVHSMWILPAAVALTVVSVLIAKQIGTFHPLYDADFSHVAGYVAWTIFQQFLLQDYFLPRMIRLLSSATLGILVVGSLFATAHLPNLPLTITTLVWGVISCALFRRYRNIYVLGLAQGLLGLTFAVCVPDAMHHHMRVGLGFLQYTGH